MRTLLILYFCILLCVAWAASAWADGPQFTGTCNGLSWAENQETDLAGYRLYDRVSLSDTPTERATYGAQITAVTCASLGLNAGQHYFSIAAFDTSGNESPRTTDIAFVLVQNQVSDLRVTAIGSTDMTLTFTEVDDGTGLAPADYDVRLASPVINWGTAASVTSGTCSTTLVGSAIGASRNCTVTGLSLTTDYQFQLVPFRGTLGQPGVVYGPLSNIAGGTTGSAPPSTGRTTLFSDNFVRANGPLVSPWTNGYTSMVSGVIDTNAVIGASIGEHYSSYQLDMQADAQWAQIELATFTGAELAGFGVMLRANASPTVSFLLCYGTINDGSYTSAIGEYVNGTWMGLVTENATTWVATDVLRCEDDEISTRLYRNDALLLTATNATRQLGRTGLFTWVTSGGTLTNAAINNFQMGGFEATAVETCGCDNH